MNCSELCNYTHSGRSITDGGLIEQDTQRKLTGVLQDAAGALQHLSFTIFHEITTLFPNIKKLATNESFQCNHEALPCRCYNLCLEVCFGCTEVLSAQSLEDFRNQRCLLKALLINILLREAPFSNKMLSTLLPLNVPMGKHEDSAFPRDTVVITTQRGCNKTKTALCTVS